jgi:prepilin signal peptidase PulO-like enzyme (type II secretory pathway)
LAGLWLGFYFMPVFFICAGLLGILWGIVWRVFVGQSRFPFGPALIVALYICLLLNPFQTL